MARGILGTGTERRETRPPGRADELAGLALADADGTERALGDFWRDGPAVLVLLRHYG